jgi:membrane-bound ClpP family serine protease
MEPIVWSVLLLVAALVLVGLEVFVPSAGIISCLAALAVIASIIVAFMESVTHGLVMLAVTSVLLPSVIAAAIRWWPHTPIGRLVLIPRPANPDDVLPESEEYRGLKSLIGRYGVARSTMLPSGSVRIENRTYDAISDGMPVDVGQRIKVVDVRTNRIVVRPLAPDESIPDEPVADDVLSRPLDSLGLDDPLS